MSWPGLDWSWFWVLLQMPGSMGVQLHPKSVEPSVMVQMCHSNVHRTLSHISSHLPHDKWKFPTACRLTVNIYHWKQFRIDWPCGSKAANHSSSSLQPQALQYLACIRVILGIVESVLQLTIIFNRRSTMLWWVCNKYIPRYNTLIDKHQIQLVLCPAFRESKGILYKYSPSSNRQAPFPFGALRNHFKKGWKMRSHLGR